MPLDIVVGAQWGDEGKGRIVDLLAAGADVVARYNGGDNAGHTVTTGAHTFKLHLIPSGIIHRHTLAVIGGGTVVNPATLLAEMDLLRAAGIAVDSNRLRLSFAAHMITPAHQALDHAQEAARAGAQIGTTRRGIGPAYTDKAARRGLRLLDMLDVDSFRRKILDHTGEANHWLKAVYGAEMVDAVSIADQYAAYAEMLAPYIDDVGMVVTRALEKQQTVLAEGAQGTLLDLDAGTYPFVTSSYPTAGGVWVGMGIGISPARRVIGVTKSFQTRVGAGPFPTELFGEFALRLRGTGANPWDEFGTTTGRPRRVGWLDGVLLRYAVRVNGLTELAVTKLDILTGLKLIRICSAYRCGSQTLDDLPFGPADLSPFEPVYEEVPGWDADVNRARLWDDLPAEAQQFIRRLEAIAGVPVRLISVGPERQQVVAVER
ncbi:MAG: adenylosuccinate synthase [Anaerolineaceae bacterium]|jgi:adenylosuccinate synthase